jgi:hypothetical protein
MNTAFQLSNREGDEVAVVGEVEVPQPRAALTLDGEERHQVVPVDMHLARPAHGLVASEQLLLDVGLARYREQRRQHVEVAADVVRHDARRDLPGPAHHARHPEGAPRCGSARRTSR